MPSKSPTDDQQNGKRKQYTLIDLERLAAGIDESQAHSANGVTPKKDKRYRGQFRFWLDANKPDELAIGRELAGLKNQRTFQATIRHAIRLFFDLKAGRVDVLLELFPWVKEQLQPSAQAAPSDLFNELLKIQHDLEAIKRQQAQAERTSVTLDQRSAPALAPVQRSSVTVEVVSTKKASAQEVANNFLASMGGLFD